MPGTLFKKKRFPGRKRGFRGTISLLSPNLSFPRKISLLWKLAYSKNKPVPNEYQMPCRFYQRRGAVQIRCYGADYTIRNGNWILWVDTFSEEELSEIKEVFAMYDKHKNGSIKLKKLGVILRTLGQMPTEDELIHLFHEVDADNSGKIEFPEFATLIAKRRSDPKEDMTLAFEAFDQNGDKLISREELSKFVYNVGEVLDDMEIEEMMENIDCDGDGFIDYEEFVYMMTH